MKAVKKTDYLIFGIIVLAVVSIGIYAFVSRDKYKNSPAEQQASQNVAIEAVSEDFELEAATIDLEKLKSNNVPIMINFSTQTCGACRTMMPIVKAMNKQMQGKVIVKYVDAKKYPNVASKFPAAALPTQVFYDAQGNPYTPNPSLGIEFVVIKDTTTEEHTFTIHKGALTGEQLKSIFKDMGADI